MGATTTAVKGEELLEELGFTADDIDGLRASGVIPHAWHLTAVAAGGGQ